ncbi:hypothetical protein, partial [Chromobacterium haemolyticum]|uniref:hypothetical protein n=1 Tax=Chromobacterium haemolyticum TaxID=394935 RepID=UPI00058470B4
MTELEKQLLAVLRECDEAMAYMSEYDIPLTLPDRVKEAIAAAEAAQAMRHHKPVATVRVTHKGYCMKFSTYVAYALPEGMHDVYAVPQPAA